VGTISKPLVTVLINTYNYAHFIEDSINSVLDQTLGVENMEIIVVDDGSTDDTAHRMDKYDGKIIYIQKKNSGQASAFNLGFQHASGELIAFLDSDDYWVPDKLKVAVDNFKKHDALDIFYHNLQIVNSPLNSVQPYFSDMPAAKAPQKVDLARYLRGHIRDFPPTSGMMFRKSCLEKIMPMPEHYQVCADTYLHYFAYFYAREILFVPELFGYYRKHGANQFENGDLLKRLQRLIHFYSILIGDLTALGETSNHDVNLLTKRIGKLVACWKNDLGLLNLLKSIGTITGHSFVQCFWMPLVSLIVEGNRIGRLYFFFKERIVKRLHEWSSRQFLTAAGRRESFAQIAFDPAKHVILGTAVGYKINDIQPFILSLKATGFQGRIVLYVEDLESNAARYLRSCSVETLQFEPGYMPVSSMRYFLYKQFLEHENAIDYVMLTDVRDVIFQSNPFDSCTDNALYCFEEDKSTTLRSCVYNSNWILRAYGQGVLAALGHKAIICSGVTMGSLEQTREYLRTICKELKRVPAVSGIDQGVHNAMIYAGKLPNAVILANESGWVYTMHYVKSDKITINQDGYIANRSGVPAVVHQYDRHPMFLRAVQDKYSSD
jgi:hypothetical protein